jgi:hypothetical protein
MISTVYFVHEESPLRARTHAASTVAKAREVAATLVKTAQCDVAAVYGVTFNKKRTRGKAERLCVASTKPCASCEGEKGACPFRVNHDVTWEGAPKNASKAKKVVRRLAAARSTA